MSEWKDLSYFIVDRGKPAGPYSLEQLSGMKLKSTDFVKSEHMEEFKELREIPGLSTLLGTDFEYTQPQYFATMDTRLLAAAIDYFLITCLYALVAIVYANTQDNIPAEIPKIIAGMVSIPILKFVSGTIAEATSWQGSLGKKLIGIKVVSTQGKRPDLGRAFLRNFTRLLCYLSLGLGFILGFFDRKQQCWHDKIARTYVIRSRLL